jgi:hypothetical protein
VPSHSSGFAPLASRGLLFCDNTNSQLYNDPSTNTTLKIVSTVFAAVAASFPDSLFHLGGDETQVVNGTVCTADAIHTFEKALQVRVCTARAWVLHRCVLTRAGGVLALCRSHWRR